MPKPRTTETNRAQTYRLPERLLERIDAFVEGFAATHGLRTTATEVVTKAITEYLDRREPELKGRRGK